MCYSVIVMSSISKMDFRLKLKNTYSSVLRRHTLLMKVCLCGRYRQLNSVLYPNNHILKTYTVVCFFLLQNSTQRSSFEPFIIIYVWQFLKIFLFRKFINLERMGNFKERCRFGPAILSCYSFGKDARMKPVNIYHSLNMLIRSYALHCQVVLTSIF